MTIISRGKLLTRVPVFNRADDPQWYEFKFAPSDLQTIAFHNRDNRSWRAKKTELIIHNAYEFPSSKGAKRIAVKMEVPKDQELPSIYIEKVEFSFNHFPEWPPAYHKAILFDSPNMDNPKLYATEVLTKFMSKAYRRPLREGELAPKMALFQRKFAQTQDFITAIREPLIATLVSPQFLFINEDEQPSPEKRRTLNDFELASRLSYLFWQSMPDLELFTLAWESYSPRHNKDQKLPDMHGTLPDGTKVNNVTDLKKVFLEKYSEDLLRSVTKNFLIYALGRPLDLSDDEVIQAIVKHLQANQNQARELIHAVVTSKPFLEK